MGGRWVSVLWSERFDGGRKDVWVWKSLRIMSSVVSDDSACSKETGRSGEMGFFVGEKVLVCIVSLDDRYKW